MKSRYLLVAAAILVLAGCKKESVTPPISTTATYTLSNCGFTSVQGDYNVGSSLTNANTVTFQVNVTQVGTYSITTSTIQGFQFSGSGSFTVTGIQNLILKGTGASVNIGTYTFLVSAGSSTCTFPVTVSIQLPGNIDNDHMLFGNPSSAAPLSGSENNYLMRKQFYSLSYNRSRGTANWVSWHLFQGDLGGTPRQDDFRPDNTLPPGWYQVHAASFSGSGFDRGHNCPSADRTSSVDANSSTFLMTNMIPQAPAMNQGTWAKMEDSLRRLVSLGAEVYIIMGSYGSGGTGNNGFATTVDGGNVTVPSTVWKVALVIPNGNNDSSRVDVNSRLISVSIPNTNSASNNWKTYRTSVDAIESATGYDLLSILPPALQAILESRIDNF